MKNKYFAYRSFWPEPETHRAFNEIGVDTVCFFAANTTNSLGEPYCLYPPFWVADGSYGAEGAYDFGPVDAQIDDLRRDSPGARFICMIDLNTPTWLQWRLQCNSMTQLGRVCSDPEWRRVTARYLRAFLAHAEERYPGEMAAYVLSGGSTSEWYDHSQLAESKSRSAAWDRELTANGLPSADIPGLTKREHLSFDNLLRDPETDGEALRYIKFCANQVVDTITFFLRQAREAAPAATELGIFFGYPLVLQGGRVILGNNDCRELLKCADLDFIISPEGGFSTIGNVSGDLGPTESVALAGKRYLRECDQKTHSFNRKLSKYVTAPWPGTYQTQAETIAGVKRELAYTLIKQCSLWWFDMWGGFFSDPPVMEWMARLRELYWGHIETPVTRTAEIALIVDCDSIYYLNQNDNERVSWFYHQTKTKLGLLGAPFECYHFEDVPNIPERNRIKLWILPGIFELTPEKQAVLDEFVRCGGNTVVTLYAPGISDGATLDPRRIKRLTGFEFGTPGVNVADLDDHRSAYFATGPDLTVPALKDLATRAGVHLYTDLEQPVYANSRFLAVHTVTSGMQTVRLPGKVGAVRELFTGRLVAENTDEFELEFQSPDTALFQLT
jgi:hypothetical protein